MTSKQIIFMDLGDGHSVMSSFVVAHLFSMKLQRECYFIVNRKYITKTYQLPGLNFVAAEDVEGTIDCLKDSFVVDFTEPGKGVVQTALLFEESYNFYLQQDVSYSQNAFNEKIEYVETISKMDDLLSGLRISKQAPVLTYSPELASILNLRGIPTLELCYRFKKPGSFLPGSVIIFGETFGLLRKDEIQLIFEFYQNGKIEDLFLNKGVLEVDWDLLYYKLDKRNNSILTKKYPVSLTESFLDLFLRSFLMPQNTRDFSLEQLMSLSQQMDHIDIEMTLDFIRKTLQRCLLDIEKKKETLTQAHWNWVRPYVDCYSKNKRQQLKQALQQSVVGLDMYMKINERQRRVVGMH